MTTHTSSRKEISGPWPFFVAGACSGLLGGLFALVFQSNSNKKVWNGVQLGNVAEVVAACATVLAFIAAAAAWRSQSNQLHEMKSQHIENIKEARIKRKFEAYDEVLMDLERFLEWWRKPTGEGEARARLEAIAALRKLRHYGTARTRPFASRILEMERMALSEIRANNDLPNTRPNMSKKVKIRKELEDRWRTDLREVIDELVSEIDKEADFDPLPS